MIILLFTARLSQPSVIYAVSSPGVVIIASHCLQEWQNTESLALIHPLDGDWVRNQTGSAGRASNTSFMLQLLHQLVTDGCWAFVLVLT